MSYVNAAGMKYRNHYAYIQSVIDLEKDTRIYMDYPVSRIVKRIEYLEDEMNTSGVADRNAMEKEVRGLKAKLKAYGLEYRKEE